jgi:hypothetical protein
MSSETAQAYLDDYTNPVFDLVDEQQDAETYRHAVIGVFDTHLQAEHMIKQLEKSGYSLKQLSIVGKGYHSEEHPVGFYTVRDRVKSWGGAGLFWGGFWGLLFGAAFFWIPGIGPVAAAGPFIHLLATGVEGAAVVGGLSVVGAALVSLGLPKKDVVKYERLLKADRFLVIAHGTELEILKAQYLMEQEQAAETATVGV